MISRLFVIVFYLANLSICDERGSRVKRIVGGIPAAEPPPDDPTIFANFAGKSARVQGIIDFPHYVFRGIKYAYAPVGKNRFLRPREKLLDGLINATYYAPPCVQPRPGTNEVIGSEDCLALNVFTPELPTGIEGLPVVVWIHGGGFRYGSASQYGVRHLVGKRLVVVTIQYRLGSLGFISSGTKQLPGNVALWDMALAIQWVRNYIGFFGGNPYRINVMGHGTGASSVLMVALSNIAKGIPSGVIAMSGTAVSSWAVDNTPQMTANIVAKNNGCPTYDALTMVKCLQSLPAESVIKVDSQIQFSKISERGFMGGLSGRLGSAPVTEGLNDGRSLPGIVQEDAMDEMQKGKPKGIPLLTGICKDETKRAVNGPLKEDIVKKINVVPDFLKNQLVPALRNLIPLKIQLDLKEIKKKFEENFQKGIENLENIFSKFIPPNFTNYVKLKTGKITEALDKVADITNDALFNVPAFLTADTWGVHGAPTYLYSFDHFGRNSKGHTFLKGVPLVGNDTHFVDLNNTVAHGDDLAYLFDANDIEGNPLNNEDQLTKEDLRVRELFTQMIADFARFGAPKVNNKPASPFNAKKNNFIRITASPSISTDFKFCEMALWCNIAERLKSTTCEFLKALDTSFRNMQNFVNGLKNQTNLTPEKILEHFNALKNLTGQGVNIFNQTGLSNLAPDKVFKEISEKIKNVSIGIHNILPPHEHNGFDILHLFDKKNDSKKNGFNLIPNIFEKKEPKQNGFQLIPNLFEKKQNTQPEQANKGGLLDIFNIQDNSKKKSEESTPKLNLFEALINKDNVEGGVRRAQDPATEILGENNESVHADLFKNEDFGTIPVGIDTPPEVPMPNNIATI